MQELSLIFAFSNPCSNNYTKMTKMWFTQHNMVWPWILKVIQFYRDIRLQRIKQCKIIKTRCFETGISPILFLKCSCCLLINPCEIQISIIPMWRKYRKKIKHPWKTDSSAIHGHQTRLMFKGHALPRIICTTVERLSCTSGLTRVRKTLWKSPMKDFW